MISLLSIVKGVMVNKKELENNPKEIRTLIGLKPCFYKTIKL